MAYNTSTGPGNSLNGAGGTRPGFTGRGLYWKKTRRTYTSQRNGGASKAQILIIQPRALRGVQCSWRSVGAGVNSASDSNLAATVDAASDILSSSRAPNKMLGPP